MKEKTKRVILVLTLLLVTVAVGLTFFKEDAKLLHNKKAIKITEERFLESKSDFEVINSHKNNPAFKEKLSKTKYHEMLYYTLIMLTDHNSNVDYIYDREIYDSKIKITTLSKQSKQYTIPNNKEWQCTPVNEILSFSCGCECYYKKSLRISNQKHFMNINGKNSAISKNKQGVYVLNKEKGKWTKLTPKIKDDFKVINKGCTLLYKHNSNYYSLDIC